MKKQYLTLVMSFFIFACGGNAENIKTEKSVEIVEVTSKNKVQEIEVEEKEVNEIITEAKSENKTEEKAAPIIIVENSVTEDVNAEIIVVEEDVKVEELVLAVTEFPKAKHEAWNSLTQKYVSAAGKVNYKGMKADLSKIKAYLLHLEKTAPKSTWSKNEKLAYWINLYNASTVYLIASNYPVKSITKINGGKPWDKKFIKSGSKVYSLNDIENTIVRPTFKDPRIHAALNCAAVSCPKLLNGAFLPASLNAQLDKQVRAWVNDVSKNKLSGNKVQISQIFDWYKVDFKGGVIAFLNKYNSTNIAVETKAKISYLEYNWALNE